MRCLPPPSTVSSSGGFLTSQKRDRMPLPVELMPCSPLVKLYNGYYMGMVKLWDKYYVRLVCLSFACKCVKS